jgi:hypothetical protein
VTMPQLYATEQARKQTEGYVSRHFSNVGWLFRNRKVAPRKDPSERLILEDDKDDDAEDVDLSVRSHPSRASSTSEVSRTYPNQ